MQVDEPSWKIRTRPCPFYSQGKCYFAKNCSFLHQAKSTPIVIHAPGTESSFSQWGETDTGITAPSEIPSNDTNRHSRHYSNTYAEQYDSDTNSETEEDTSDVDSPTIRKRILSSTVNTRESGVSRDSVVTVKGDPYGTEATSYSLSYYHSEHRKRSSVSSRAKPPEKISEETGLSPSSLHPGAMGGLLSEGHTPTSVTSANAQELEVPVLSGPMRTVPPFTLADAASSSLMTNRLAKARGPPPSPPSLATPVGNPLTPFSAGALYASYQDNEPAPKPDSPLVQNDASMDVAMDVPPPEHMSPTPHVASKTPTWLKPLRLASTMTPPTESRTSISSSDLEQAIDASTTKHVTSFSPPPSVPPGPSDSSPVARDTFTELYRRSTTHIPTNTPHTIVLSDHDGFVSPLTLSRTGSLDIDMSNFPPPPTSSSGASVHDVSSPTSISLSELTGRSPRARPIPRVPASDDIVPTTDTPLSLDRATTAAEQLRSALERRARRMKEGSMLLASADISQFNFDDASPSNARSLLLESTVETSLSHSRNASSSPDSYRSRSWNKLPQLESNPRDGTFPNAQSSPPRNLLGLLAKPSGKSSPSSLASAAVLSHTPSPDPSPRPELLFAIASDQPAEVERLLSTGKAYANETTGSGAGVLEFTVANEGLKNKTEIVKTLLKYGADPDSLKRDIPSDDNEHAGVVQQSPGLAKKVEEHMNPALKYYLNRPQSLDIDSKPALEALQQSSFAPLARARFDIIGQDRALDELYRVLGVQPQRKGKNALVILLCGASGHGKSMLAQKVGSLLDVPTHTINMTALRSQHDLWQCLSTGMDDASPHLDLSEFLVGNQGKRCVVVLDEIEKVDDSKSLNPLLLPWDIGRCSLEQKKHTDTSKVIWIATSNLGQKIICEHVEQWGHPDTPPTRSEYTQLATAIRRHIAEVLGASLLSRVTTILPFLPFTEVEKFAIGTEAALSHQEFTSTPLSSAEIEEVVQRAVKDVNFVEAEGARSLYRVVETHMIRTQQLYFQS